MTDVTATLNVCLTARSAPVVTSARYSIDKLDAFVREAYKINSAIGELSASLRAARPAYLSTSTVPRRTSKDKTRSRPYSDTDRVALDSHAKLVLRQLLASTARLEDTEALRHEAARQLSLGKRAKSGLGALSRWAAGGAVTARSTDEVDADGREETLTRHRTGVVAFLKQRLGNVSAYHLGMMEVRLKREEERTKSALSKSPVADTTPWNVAVDEGLKADADADADGDGDEKKEALSEEQIQLFARENQNLLRHFEHQRDQLRTTQRSIEEVAELQSALVANLDTQAQSIQQLVQDSFSTSENIGRGNRELKRATERVSTARLCFHGTVALCAFLIVWDLAF